MVVILVVGLLFPVALFIMFFLLVFKVFVKNIIMFQFLFFFVKRKILYSVVDAIGHILPA